MPCGEIEAGFRREGDVACVSNLIHTSDLDAEISRRWKSTKKICEGGPEFGGSFLRRRLAHGEEAAGLGSGEFWDGDEIVGAGIAGKTAERLGIFGLEGIFGDRRTVTFLFQVEGHPAINSFTHR